MREPISTYDGTRHRPGRGPRARAAFHLSEALRLEPENADAKAELAKTPRASQ